MPPPPLKGWLGQVFRRKPCHSKEDYDTAIKDFDEVTRTCPNDVSAYSRLAWLLATCPVDKYRDGKQAIRLATKACELTAWKSGLELDTLAAAYAEIGEYREAEHYQVMALEDSDYQGPDGDEFRLRLELYEQDKPFRERVM